MTTHRERIQACLAGEMPDQTPVALWRHFPVDDQLPETLAAAQIAFQRAYDFDLVKVTPASSFCLRDWGARDEWRGNPEGTRQYSGQVVVQPQDWERLPALDPGAPHLAGQLACLRQIRAGLGPNIPMLQTVFNPLAQAKNLAGGNTLLVHIRKHPDAVLKGLQTIAQTTRRFVEAALETGIDGIFYAIQHAQASLLSEDEFRHFSRSLDLQILESAQGLWCNMLHLHGEDVYFQELSKYPVPMLNWHDRETPPSLAEAQAVFQGAVCGGLNRETLVFKTAQDVRQEKEDAIQQTGGRRLILSTGCVVPVIAPHGNILAAK
ncbi:MAG TPA: uroporphyrinogen decarboxylase family protein [Anaerolineales bacterium]|nr:uroporphyrinogen decarboxylase family protein [Anaerolineales bacterium]